MKPLVGQRYLWICEPGKNRTTINSKIIIEITEISMKFSMKILQVIYSNYFSDKVGQEYVIDALSIKELTLLPNQNKS